MRLAQLLVIAAKRADYKRVQKAADDYREAMQALAVRAFARGRARLSRERLVKALKNKDERAVLTLVSTAIEAVEKGFEGLEDLLLDVMNASATSMQRRLRASSSLWRMAYDEDQPRDEQGQWTSGDGGDKRGKSVKPIIKTIGEGVEADVPKDLVDDAQQIAEILTRFDDAYAEAYVSVDGDGTIQVMVQVEEGGKLVREVTFNVSEQESDLYLDIVNFDKTTTPREARETLRTVLDAADDADVDTLSLEAGLEDGGYLWAKLGFEADAPKEFTRMVKDRLQKMRSVSGGFDEDEAQDLKDFIEAHQDDPKLPQLLADEPGGKRLLRGSRWRGTLNRKEKGALDRMNKFLGKKRSGGVQKAAAKDEQPLLERLILGPDEPERGRAAAPRVKDFSFDKTNPAAQEWASEHAAETITGISETTREEIRELVEGAFEEQYDVDELADKIAELIGDDARAETIARTETMRASNEGQQQLWDQAEEAGLLSGDEKKEWIVTPDDRLCPICEPMDGVTVGLSEDFDVDGEQLDGPPAHPNCRCTIALSV